MFLAYDFIFSIYTIIYLPYLLLTRRWHKDFGGRFGLLSDLAKQSLLHKPNIWVHAVSVGEVMVVEGLIRQLKEAFPTSQVVLSVTTKTGYELAQQRLGTQVMVIAAPLDFSFIVARFIRLVKPCLYVATETEIWPNLFAALARKNVPIAIINGRLSDKSFPRYLAIRFLLRKVLAHVNIFCMQSQIDAQRIMDLGAIPSRVKVTGNIKFDIAKAFSSQDYRFSSKLLWICGSTHPGEEEIILDIFSKMRAEFPEWQLVIAPRHVERTDEIITLVKNKGFKAARLSTMALAQGNEHSVVIVDAIGHLRSLYALASLVFVGKSLCGGGGQNIIEPALVGKPIMVGPRTENFRDIVTSFKKANAIIEVESVDALRVVVRDLMGDESRRAQLGQRARAVIDENQGATKRSLVELAQLLK